MVVEEIEKVRSQREAEEKDAKSSGQKPQAAKAKEAAAAGKKPEAPKATTTAATASGKTPEAPKATAAATAAASKDEKTEVQDEEKNPDIEATTNAKPAETKEERRKRLHARNMRFYRSFTSTLFAMMSGVQSCMLCCRL